MKKGWEVKKLGEVYDVRDGTHDSPKYQESGYALITSKNLKDDDLTFDNIKYISYEDYVNINKRSKVDIGDVLFAMIGTIGNPVVVEQEPNFAIKNVALFKVNEKQNSNFLKYFLESPFVIKKMLLDAKGTTQKFVGLGYLRDFSIPIPPLPEQQRIVSILDEAFAAIDRAKENVQRNLQNAKALFQSELNSIFATKGEGWEEKKLGEVFSIKPPKNEAKEKLDNTDLVTFLPMEDLGILDRKIYPRKEKQLKEVTGSYTYFADEDVLLAKITPCFENGKLGIARGLKNGIGFGSSEYIVFRSKGDVIPDFLFYFLSRDRFRIEGESKMQGAVGHKRVAKDFIENYILPFPVDKIKQQEVVLQLNTLSTETKKLESIYQQKLDSLEALKKSILRKAFRGELSEPLIAADLMINYD